MYCQRNCPRFVAISVLFVLLSGCGSGSFSQSTPPSPPVASQPESSPVTVAWGRFPRPPVGGRYGGTRGPICLVTPGSSNEPVMLWSDRPFFVWSEKFTTGSANKVALYKQGSETVVWSREISEASQTTTAMSQPSSPGSAWMIEQSVYEGEALRLGQEYSWVVFDALDRQLGSGSFRVMSPEEREAISADLKALEDRLTAEGATAEEIAFEKATYFAEKQLWSDAWQVAFSVKSPSPELIEFRSQIPTQLCPSE